jgi:hypothetical protein
VQEHEREPFSHPLKGETESFDLDVVRPTSQQSHPAFERPAVGKNSKALARGGVGCRHGEYLSTRCGEGDRPGGFRARGARIGYELG